MLHQQARQPSRAAVVVGNEQVPVGVEEADERVHRWPRHRLDGEDLAGLGAEAVEVDVVPERTDVGEPIRRC